MRRVLVALVLAGALASVAGCARPGPADGDLTDDWPALPAARPFVPAAGVCLPRISAVAQAAGYETVDCARPHLAETIHVGTVDGTATVPDRPATDTGPVPDGPTADRTPTDGPTSDRTPTDGPTADRAATDGTVERPAAGSAALRAIRADCDQRTREVLGGDWRSARLTLQVTLPSTAAWAAGARWYRCDLSETGSLDNNRPVVRSGSLRGALIGDSPLTHRCFDPKLIADDLNYMAPVLCTEPHRAEFVGVYREREMSWARFAAADDAVHRRCLGLIAEYAKVPNNGDLPYRVGSIFYPPSRQEWAEGDRGVRCFLWSDDRKLTRSMRGAGPAGLPAS
ncbi:septum formation family protein [Micromonospora cathayae]|uniref:Septum formation family protein n=1 Tax=Micromonospora cathayae TaxID=3028804 RepID=A0ABY7ZKA7_9ACTN|nr:septum formation family protein [Micromonospora sp. HUAS 3]WDZ82344.1 septum formation family protein [Micromonospora sp. HUAS 3]